MLAEHKQVTLPYLMSTHTFLINTISTYGSVGGQMTSEPSFKSTLNKII